ncbi:hypothetical protein PanWU01x14_145480 [Parasponia andersonii]|uniref:Uncharacterized protein n=1 Tax=Parasponia andersonii TaxID=3476 RepID=A0A2P5CK47_PARAD|nr:hypothetical protein PanWU01x14_145480 [Parasponia andersonii]
MLLCSRRRWSRLKRWKHRRWRKRNATRARRVHEHCSKCIVELNLVLKLLVMISHKLIKFLLNGTLPLAMLLYGVPHLRQLLRQLLDLGRKIPKSSSRHRCWRRQIGRICSLV